MLEWTILSRGREDVPVSSVTPCTASHGGRGLAAFNTRRWQENPVLSYLCASVRSAQGLVLYRRSNKEEEESVKRDDLEIHSYFYKQPAMAEMWRSGVEVEGKTTRVMRKCERRGGEREEVRTELRRKRREDAKGRGRGSLRSCPTPASQPVTSYRTAFNTGLTTRTTQPNV